MSAKTITSGLRANWLQFTLLVVVNGFVGAMVGLERTIIPLIAEENFGLVSKSIVLSFLISFGVVRALANLFAGHLGDRWGCKRVLIAGWQLTGQLALKEEVVAEKRQRSGRFIVATNVLDKEHMPNTTLLNVYKEQGSAVERGFRFLRAPLFFADSLFLKNPARIMAMIMIMGLALLVYALAERQIRQQLATQDETIPDQKGKPIQRPTMRRVAQIFEGVDLLTIHQDGQIVLRQVLNMTDVHRKIVRLLDPEVEYCYLVDF